MTPRRLFEIDVMALRSNVVEIVTAGTAALIVIAVAVFVFVLVESVRGPRRLRIYEREARERLEAVNRDLRIELAKLRASGRA